MLGGTHEELRRRIIITPPHERNKVQYPKQPLPRTPFQTVQRRKWEAGGERASIHRRGERDKDGELLAEIGTHAEGEGDEGETVALGVADEGDLGVSDAHARKVFWREEGSVTA